MANVPNSSLHTWVNSETITDSKLNQDVQVLQSAINDNDSRITTLQGTGWTNQTVKGNADALTTHKSSGDHDSRYYTQTQSDTNYYSKSTVDSKVSDLAGAGRTTETVKGNADALTTHKSSGDHDSRYYTQTQLNAGQLDNRYYTQTQLTGGQLDSRYYTQSQSDGKYVLTTDTRLHNSTLVGTHNVDEGLIADGKVLMYQASTGNIVYQSVPGLSGQTVVADGTIQTNLNADMVDNHHVGTAAGNIPALDNNGMIPASMIPSVSKASVSDVQITGTTAQTVATYTPTAKGNFEAKIYYRVVTGTTNVTVTVTYTDGTGVQTNTVLNAQSSAVGSYSCLPVFINATTGSAISINVTASVANQVYASASIVGY